MIWRESSCPLDECFGSGPVAGPLDVGAMRPANTQEQINSPRPGRRIDPVGFRLSPRSISGRGIQPFYQPSALMQLCHWSRSTKTNRLYPGTKWRRLPFFPLSVLRFNRSVYRPNTFILTVIFIATARYHRNQRTPLSYSSSLPLGRAKSACLFLSMESRHRDGLCGQPAKTVSATRTLRLSVARGLNPHQSKTHRNRRGSATNQPKE